MAGDQVKSPLKMSAWFSGAGAAQMALGVGNVLLPGEFAKLNVADYADKARALIKLSD